MEAWKTLSILVIIFGVVINGEETDRESGNGREARCHGKSAGKQNQKQVPDMRKPYPLIHQNERKFIGKKEFPSKVSVSDDYSAPSKAELRKPYQKNTPQETLEEPFNMFTAGDALVADPMEIPSTVGVSPRLSISADGDISLGRSLNFNKNRSFQDDSDDRFDHAHDEHIDEDHDHFHKIRTARSAPSSAGSGPQQLASTLEDLKETNTVQGVNVSNGANSGSLFNMNASGNEVSSTNQGSSSASGSGTISATGYTSVTTSGKNQ